MTDTRDLIYKLLEVAECYSDGIGTCELYEQILREARSYLNNEGSEMTNQHPITPPPSLIEQWHSYSPLDRGKTLAAQASQWGADQELEAILQLAGQTDSPEEDRYFDGFTVASIRAARRPKPPSLKQQVLETLKYPKDLWSEAEVDAIRRLVEQLDD